MVRTGSAVQFRSSAPEFPEKMGYMKDGGFAIYIPDASSSVAEWRKAQQAPRSELPPLTSEQKEVARQFGITEEEYQRNVLAGQYGRARMQERAQALGGAVQDVLDRLGGGYRVIAVSRDMDRLGWTVRIETQKEDVDVFVSQELADDLFDSGSGREKERLRVRVESSLPQTRNTKKT